MKKKKEITKVNFDALKEAFKGDIDLMHFYVLWIKNELNATAAYRELHPDVTTGSAEVLGSRLLGKVKDRIGLEAMASVYGLDLNTYFKQLKDGISAERSDMTGQIFPDHRVREPYHTKLGKILGIELDKPTVGIVNTGEMTLEFTGKDESNA